MSPPSLPCNHHCSSSLVPLTPVSNSLILSSYLTVGDVCAYHTELFAAD